MRLSECAAAKVRVTHLRYGVRLRTMLLELNILYSILRSKSLYSTLMQVTSVLGLPKSMNQDLDANKFIRLVGRMTRTTAPYRRVKH